MPRSKWFTFFVALTKMPGVRWFLFVAALTLVPKILTFILRALPEEGGESLLVFGVTAILTFIVFYLQKRKDSRKDQQEDSD